MSRTATQISVSPRARRLPVRQVRPNRKLQALRINAGLSPNGLALRAGVSGNTVRAAERGFNVHPFVQLAIAEVFELRPLDIWPLEGQVQR